MVRHVPLSLFAGVALLTLCTTVRADAEPNPKLEEALKASTQALVALDAAKDQPGREAQYRALWQLEEDLFVYAEEVATAKKLGSEEQALSERMKAAPAGSPEGNALRMARSLLRLAAARAAYDDIRAEDGDLQLAAARKLWPDALMPRLEAAKQARRRERWADVIDALMPLADKAPTSLGDRPEVLAILAEAHLHRGEGEAACALAEMILPLRNSDSAVERFFRENSNDLSMAFVSLAGGANEANNRDEALRLLQRAVDVAGDEPTNQFANFVGPLLLQLGDQKTAEVLAARVRANAPAPRRGNSEVRQAANLQQAAGMARSSNSKILAYMHMKGCPQCLRFERELLPSNDVQEALAEDYIFVNLPLETQEGAALADALEVTAAPAFAVLSADGQPTAVQVGAPETAGDFADWLGQNR